MEVETKLTKKAKRSAKEECIGEVLITAERENIEYLKRREENRKSKAAMIELNSTRKEVDEDESFFKSIMPHIRQFSPKTKMQFRIKVTQLVQDSMEVNPPRNEAHVTEVIPQNLPASSNSNHSSSSITTYEVENELQCQGQSDARNFDQENKATESNKLVYEQKVSDSEMSDANCCNSSRRTSSSSSNGNDSFYSENDTTDNSESETNNDVDDNQSQDSNFNGEVMFSDSGLTKQEVLMIVHGLSLKHRLSNEARNDVLLVI
ncbi:hypothetical protein RN001_008773 [Aquatica leii]|uniref:BESS domain-containing protein n=1 Tax=Aquatica leii TaxID=1421715 RepID=A0AAN7PZG6_9COLE|nr:hypothetical protein RN001_008773 [Aquatica leii]